MSEQENQTITSGDVGSLDAAFTPEEPASVSASEQALIEQVEALTAARDQLTEEHRVLTADFQAACDGKATAEAQLVELTAEVSRLVDQGAEMATSLQAAEAYTEKFQTELLEHERIVGVLTAERDAARAEFVAGTPAGVTHADDELSNRWIAAGGGAKDYDLAVRFARSL